MKKLHEAIPLPEKSLVVTKDKLKITDPLLAAKIHGDSDHDIEIVEVVGLTLGGKLHEVARVILTGKVYDGSTYTYPTTYCGCSDRHCVVLTTVETMKQKQIVDELKEGYYNEDFGAPYLKPNSLPALAMDIITAFYSDEWVGIHGNSVYVQHIAEMLELTFIEASRVSETLVARGQVERYGNVLNIARNQPKLPARLAGTANIKGKDGRTYLDVQVFLPNSGAEDQTFYLKVENSIETYQEVLSALQLPLKQDGSLSNKDRLYFEQWLRSNWRTITNPYGGLPEPKFSWFDSSETYVAKEYDNKNHGGLSVGDFGDWYCSWCGHSGDGMESYTNYLCEVKDV